MKEFKKWEYTHSPGEYAYQKWEEGWRGALEWVLRMFLRGDSFGSIAAKIKAELGIK